MKVDVFTNGNLHKNWVTRFKLDTLLASFDLPYRAFVWTKRKLKHRPKNGCSICKRPFSLFQCCFLFSAISSSESVVASTATGKRTIMTSKPTASISSSHLTTTFSSAAILLFTSSGFTTTASPQQQKESVFTTTSETMGVRTSSIISNAEATQVTSETGT